MRLAIILLFVLLCACSGRTTGSSTGNSTGVSCSDSRETFTGYVGIGVNFTSNVQARLRDRQNRILVPYSSQNGTTQGGTAYTSEAYNNLALGTYTVEVLYQGRVLETHAVTVTAQESPVITILCQ